MRRALPLLFALLLTLSGCSALAPSASTEEPTLTPAPVPTESTESTESTEKPFLAPGLRESGIVDADAFAEAHNARLNGTYVVQFNASLRAENGTTLYTYGGSIRDGGDTEHVVRGWNRSLTIAVYRTTETQWTQRTRNGTVRYLRRDDPFTYEGLGDRVAYLLNETNASVAHRASNASHARYVFAAGDLSPAGIPDIAPGVENLTAVHFTANVYSDPKGTYVTEYAIRYRGTRDGTPVRGAFTVRFGPIDDVTVTEPAWLPEAKNETGGTPTPTA